MYQASRAPAHSPSLSSCLHHHAHPPRTRVPSCTPASCTHMQPPGAPPGSTSSASVSASLRSARWGGTSLFVCLCKLLVGRGRKAIHLWYRFKLNGAGVVVCSCLQKKVYSGHLFGIATAQARARLCGNGLTSSLDELAAAAEAFLRPSTATTSDSVASSVAGVPPLLSSQPLELGSLVTLAQSLGRGTFLPPVRVWRCN